MAQGQAARPGVTRGLICLALAPVWGTSTAVDWPEACEWRSLGPRPGCALDRTAERTGLSDRRVYSRTYSYSNGNPLMPVFGFPSQFAILPGSVTGCIRERT